MATIDVLLEQVADLQLRSRIAEQVKALTARKQFGLVFQDHTPEAIEVPGVRPRRGDTVRFRGDGDKVDHAVIHANKSVATIAAVLDDLTVSENQIEVPIGALNVVKDFGEPIYAGLKSLNRIGRGGDKPTHLVIQGENYYALEALMYTHEGKVDVIYIDPPYNTGAADWVYNDRYVESKDAYRHSKWLAFMQRRLEHAKRLLNPTGVIIMAIDDNEQARLKLLADQVLGEENFLANIVWQGGVKNDSRFSSGGVDYMLVYAKSSQTLTSSSYRWREPKPGIGLALAAVEDAWDKSKGDAQAATADYRKWLRSNKSTLTAGITEYTSIDSDGRAWRYVPLISPNPRPSLMYEVMHPLTGLPVKVPANGWNCTETEFWRRFGVGRIIFGADETGIPRGKIFLDEGSEQSPYPTFTTQRIPASYYLQNVLGSKDFPFPKDVDVVARWINIVSASNPNAIVLDFFAGTGTTAEAVMRLNARDGGRRQSIIVTNNEVGSATAKKLGKAGHLPGDPKWEAEGVYNKVTRPRIETVVTGVRRDGSTFSEGLEENVEFFELTYEDENLIQLGRKFHAIAPLLWVKAGAVGTRIDSVDTEIGWSFPEGGVYGVLFDEAKWPAFVHAVNEASDRVREAFIVTDSESAFQSIVAHLPDESARFTTTRLYADYLHTFLVNGKD